ncbi:MAG: hypothetical protein AAFV93_12635 [Chloroflexota bacterium]
MASLPRIMTVDPTGNIPAQIRAAFELMDRLVVQIDVPGPTEALEELQRGGIDAVIAAWNLGDGTQGWELAAKLRQVDDNVSIMLLGDYKDTDLDDEMREQSPFVYLKRPFDIPQLINVLKAAIDGGDIFAAVDAPTTSSGTKVDLGPVPAINADKVDEVMQGVMYDLNPIAAMVTTRDGAVVTGRTELGDADYEHMARLVGTSAEMNINMRDVIGGNLQTLQLYDGSDFDIFVLSVGLHHFLVLVFDGKDGASQIGAVRRYGSKHAENLIAIMGPAAFLVQRREVQDEPEQVVRRSDRSAKYSTQEVQQPELARADLGNSNGATTQEDTPVIQSAMPQLDAIADDDFDLDSLFGGDLDDASADDLFSLDALESLDLNEKKKGTASMEDAINLGILDDNM